VAQLLAGVRVLDLTNVLAGPFCCYQLAQVGAEVIKVEVPGVGDLARQLGADPDLNRRRMGASFLAQNAGKRSVTMNLKHPAGKDAFRRLVASADVVVENFRPGVMDRLGLGYAALKEIRPDLVYCAISGFGQDGPLRANPAYDQIIQGLSGVMSVTGSPHTAPLRVGYPVCDTMGGITAAFAIAAALFRRTQTGEGEAIDVSMLEATLVAMGWAVSNWLIAGVRPVPMGNENMSAAPSGAFRTGRGLLNIAANKQEQFEILCRLVAREELIADPRFAARDDPDRLGQVLGMDVLQQEARRAGAQGLEIGDRAFGALHRAGHALLRAAPVHQTADGAAGGVVDAGHPGGADIDRVGGLLRRGRLLGGGRSAIARAGGQREGEQCRQQTVSVDAGGGCQWARKHRDRLLPRGRRGLL